MYYVLQYKLKSQQFDSWCIIQQKNTNYQWIYTHTCITESSHWLTPGWPVLCTNSAVLSVSRFHVHNYVDHSSAIEDFNGKQYSKLSFTRSAGLQMWRIAGRDIVNYLLLIHSVWLTVFLSSSMDEVKTLYWQYFRFLLHLALWWCRHCTYIHFRFTSLYTLIPKIVRQSINQSPVQNLMTIGSWII